MKRLLAAAAFAPLAFAAHGALAQTTISNAQTTPVKTSATGDLTIDGNGSLTVPDGAAITVDSDNKVSVTGTASVRSSTTGVGILVLTPDAGRTSSVTIGGNILADDLISNVDVDKDGDLDGPFVSSGVTRYGIRVIGTGGLVGDITTTAGQINVESNGGAGISIETPMFGNLLLRGSVGVLGNNSFGVHVAGPVTGNLTIGPLSGTRINAQGEGAIGVALDADITGAVRIDGTVVASGFRYLDRNNLPFGVKLENLDADDLLIGGPAVRIRSNVTGGVVIDAPPKATSTASLDEDADGVPDSDEGTGVINSFGSAPALLIAGPTDIKLGNVSTTNGNDAFGLIIRGQVVGTGMYDGITGVAVQIGGDGGKVDTDDGIRVTGSVSGSANKADAVGLLLRSGAQVPLLLVDTGTITGGADTLGGAAVTARAVAIEQGATVPMVYNNGIIRSGVSGDAGASIAIEDKSGTLAAVANTGTISASISSPKQGVTATGQRIAVDLRSNSTGAAFGQWANGNPDFVPSVTGDILFSQGDYADSVALAAGRLTGAISFGGGSDNLLVSDGVSARADVMKASGGLLVATAGSLAFTNTSKLDLTTLLVGGTGQVTFTADPGNANPALRSTFLNVGGTASFDSGSKIALEFKSKPAAATTFTVVRAGQLVDSGLDASLLNAIPLVFVGQVSTANNEINISVRRREANELGLFGGRARAYDAFYAAFDKDPEVAAAVFSKTTTADFNKLYNQFLPDYSGGPFNSLANGARAVLQAQGEEPKNMVEGEPRSWLQEVGVGVKHESINDIEYQSAGLGLAGGFERPIGTSAAYGFSGAFLSSEVRNAQRVLGSLLTANTLMSGVYYRAHEDHLVLDASFSGGYSWFRSTRRIVDADSDGVMHLVREPQSDWGGALAAARVGVTYNWDAGPFYIRHEALIDAVYLSEQAFNETGGGAATNLHIGRRENYEAAAQAGVLMGASFGRSFRWGPELSVAYRGLIDGGEGDTVGYYLSVPGVPFSLPGLVKDRHRVLVRAALRGSGAYANFALEASGDIGEIYQAYMARVLVRFLF